MTTSKQKLISGFELRKVLHLDDIISQRQLTEKNDTFLIDFISGSETKAAIYPVTSQAEIKKRFFRSDKILFLKKSFWHYTININSMIVDTKYIEDLSKQERGASGEEYFFVERKASNKNNNDLWLFEPGTQGWVYYQEILLPQHQRDLFDVLDLANPQKKY
jgi:hypothetical protein